MKNRGSAEAIAKCHSSISLNSTNRYYYPQVAGTFSEGISPCTMVTICDFIRVEGLGADTKYRISIVVLPETR